MAPPLAKIVKDAYLTGWITFGVVIVMGPLFLGAFLGGFGLLPIHGTMTGKFWFSIPLGFTVGIAVLGVIANAAHTWISRKKYGSFWDALFTGFLGVGAFILLSQNMIPLIPWETDLTPLLGPQLLLYFIGLLLLGAFLNIIQNLIKSRLDEGIALPKAEFG